MLRIRRSSRMVRSLLVIGMASEVETGAKRERDAEGFIGPGASLLTAEDLASTFRVHVSTVYRWCSSGAIPSVRIAGTIRFDPAAVRAALKGAS